MFSKNLEFMILLQLGFNTLKRCATTVGNSRSVAYVGNALIAIIMIYARRVTTATNTIFVIDSIGSARVMLLGGSWKRGESANVFRLVAYCLERV